MPKECGSGHENASSRQAPSSSRASHRLSSMRLALIFAFTVAAFVSFIFAAAYRPTLVHPLPLPLVDHAFRVVNHVRRSVLQLPPVPASAVWHPGRRLIATSFASVRAAVPSVEIKLLWRKPLVVIFENYLTEAEVEVLLAETKIEFRKSAVILDGENQIHSARTSDTASIVPQPNTSAAAVVAKLSKLSGFPDTHCEQTVFNRYKVSQYFAPHNDYHTEEWLAKEEGPFHGCQRAVTVLLYLTDVAAGGETMFVRNGEFHRFEKDNPDHLAVKPKKGRVLMWFNMDPQTEQVDRTTQHGGAPVKDGVKLAATFFLRNCSRSEDKATVVANEDAAQRKEEL